MAEQKRFSVEDAATRIRAANGNIIAMMESVGLDPKIDFRGGDWRKCDFRGLDVRGFDFRDTRLWGAKFSNARVAGADFAGADSVDMAGLHHALDWQKAKFDDDQRATIELVAKIGSIREHPQRVLQHVRESEKPLNFLQYASLIRQARDYATAYLVLQEIVRRGLVRDASPYELVIFRCEQASQAEALLGEYLATGLPVSGKLLVGYCQHLQHVDGFRRVFELMKSAVACNPNQIFNMALKHARGIGQLMALIEVMRGEGFEPDSFTLHEIFQQNTDFTFRIEMLERWHADGFRIDTFVLNELLFYAHKAEQQQAALNWFAKLALAYDEYTYAVLIDRAESFEAASALFAQMQEQGIKPTRHSVSWLVRRARKFADACQALVLGRQAGVPIHDYRLLMLLPEKSSNPTLARRLLRDHREAGDNSRIAMRGIVNGHHSNQGKAAQNHLLLALGLRPNGEHQD